MVFGMTEIDIAMEAKPLEVDNIEPVELERIADPTVYVVTVTTNEGTFSHRIDEIDGRYWIGEGQNMSDDGTGFATVEAAKAKMEKFYREEANEAAWKRYMRENPPPERN